MTHSYLEELAQDNHPEKPGGLSLRGWLPLAVLGALLAAALLGVFGGGKFPVRTAQANQASLTVKAPHTIRNGMFFEMRVRVDAHQAMAKPQIAIDSALWRDITINTMIPAAAKEEYKGGSMVFSFDALKPGDVLEWKIDGQINPSLFGGTSGTIALLDDGRPVTALPLSLTVLP